MLRSPPVDKPRSSSTTDLERLALQDRDSQSHVSARDKRRRISDDDYDDLTAFKIEIKNMFQAFLDTQTTRLDALENHIAEIKAQVYNTNTTNKELEKSINFMSNKLEQLEQKISDMEDQRKNTQTQILNIDNKCESMEKSYKKTWIEIRNVPKKPNETKEVLFGYIQSLTKYIKYDVQTSDIRDVFRMPSKAEKDNSILIAELSNTLVKSKILNSARSFNKTYSGSQLNASHLGMTGDKSRIYLAESLTTKTRRLHFLARELAKSQGYQFCWTSNGNVFIRKREGAPYVAIRSEEQINELKVTK